MAKLNFLVIAQYFPPEMGGGATRAHNLAMGLSSLGHTVKVVTAFPNYPNGNIPPKYRGKVLSVEYTGSMKIVRTFVPPVVSKGLMRRLVLFSSFIFSSLFALFSVGDVDVILACNPNILSMVPSTVYRYAKKSIVVQNVDDLWPETIFDLGMHNKTFLATVAESTARIAYNTASMIIPISSAYVPVITGKYGVSSEKVHVIPAGVDLDLFSAQEKHDENPSGPFRVLYIGAFSPAYDFNQVFNAAELLFNSNVNFIIQGGGELASSIKLTIKERKLTNVQLVEKIVSRREVAQILQSADALLLPLGGVGAVELGISSKLYEYQAIGKPILCCSNGQSANHVLTTHSGLIIKPGDHKALAAAIIQLKDNPQRCATFGRNGRQFAEAELSLQSVAKKMISCIELQSNSQKK